MNGRWAAVLTNQCIDHLARLVERAQYHGVARYVGILAKLHRADTVVLADVFALRFVEWGQVKMLGRARVNALAVMAVLGNLRHGFVVAQAALHQRDDAP